MGQVIAVCMNKGGVGKTTLVTNLAAAITSVYPDKRVLIIDTDTQGNSGIAFGNIPIQFQRTIHDVFLGAADLGEVMVQIADNLYFVPSNKAMKTVDFDILLNVDKYGHPLDLLKLPIERIRNKFDYIFIDTPPYIGLVTSNVLNASDKVIIPFVPETYAVQGLVSVIEEIEDFKERVNPNLQLIGIAAMMFEGRTNLHPDMLKLARQYCQENNYNLFESVIPKSIRFADATAYQQKPAVWVDKNHPMVKAYFSLMEEVLQSVG